MANGADEDRLIARVIDGLVTKGIVRALLIVGVPMGLWLFQQHLSFVNEIQRSVQALQQQVAVALGRNDDAHKSVADRLDGQHRWLENHEQRIIVLERRPDAPN